MSTGIRQKKDILFCKRGGGLVSPLGPNVKILAQFSIEIWFSDTQNTFYLIVRVSKMLCSCPLRLRHTTIWPFCDRAAANSKRRIGDSNSWMRMTFFLCNHYFFDNFTIIWRKESNNIFTRLCLKHDWVITLSLTLFIKFMQAPKQDCKTRCQWKLGNGHLGAWNPSVHLGFIFTSVFHHT